MIVLSAIVLLTTMTVEFAYNSNVNNHLAHNERQRLQAYYLARSAYNFMLLELKFDKVFRQIVQSQNLGQYIGENAQLPLCQQFPMSTGLIRAVFTGGGMPGEEVAGGEGGAASEDGGDKGAPADTGGEDAEKAADEIDDMRKGASISQEQNAQDFLNFEGDFSGECFDEGTKINLNAFYSLSTTPATEGTPSAADQYKMFVYKFLSKGKYDKLFENQEGVVSDVVDNIADWVDKDTDRKDMTGRNKGAERLLYDKQEAPYTVKNSKMLSLMEAYLIDGVSDDWFGPLMDSFTIYGDGKINICTASEDIIEGLIRRYIESMASPPPIRLEDKDEMGRLVTAVTDVCASGASGEGLAQAAETALNTAIGEVSPGFIPAPPVTAGAPPQGTEAELEPVTQPQTGFAQYISTETRFFSLTLTGQIENITVRIKAVMDIKDQDPKKWKLLYWRVY